MCWLFYSIMFCWLKQMCFHFFIFSSQMFLFYLWIWFPALYPLNLLLWSGELACAFCNLSYMHNNSKSKYKKKKNDFRWRQFFSWAVKQTDGTKLSCFNNLLKISRRYRKMSSQYSRPLICHHSIFCDEVDIQWQVFCLNLDCQ